MEKGVESVLNSSSVFGIPESSICLSSDVQLWNFGARRDFRDPVSHFRDEESDAARACVTCSGSQCSSVTESESTRGLCLVFFPLCFLHVRLTKNKVYFLFFLLHLLQPFILLSIC